MSRFGNELRKLRKEKKLSLKEVAKKGDLSQGYISQIETGKRNPPKPEIIHKLAKGLDVHPSLLMFKAGYITSSKQLELLTDEIERLEKEELEAKREYLSELKEELDNQPIDSEISIIRLLELNHDFHVAHQHYEKLISEEQEITSLEKEYLALKQFENDLNNKKIRSIIDYNVDLSELLNTNIDLYYGDDLLTGEDKQNIIKFIDTFIKR